jgi:hypothetical protein
MRMDDPEMDAIRNARMQQMQQQQVSENEANVDCTETFNIFFFPAESRTATKATRTARAEKPSNQLDALAVT